MFSEKTTHKDNVRLTVDDGTVPALPRTLLNGPAVDEFKALEKECSHQRQSRLSPSALAPGEEVLTRLPVVLDRPILFLTDLSGSVTPLAHALLNRQMVASSSSALELTDNAHEAVLILGGDLNDRGRGLADLVSTVQWCRDGGLTTHALYGNHDLDLVAVLQRALPEELPKWALSWKQAKEAQSHPFPREVHFIDLDSNTQRGISHWLFTNGGMSTVEGLAGWLRATHPELCAEPVSVQEHRRLKVASPALLQPHERKLASADTILQARQSDFLHAARAVTVEPFTSYLAGLEPELTHGGLTFVHGFIPNFVGKQTSWPELSQIILGGLCAESGAWDFAFGYRYLRMGHDATEAAQLKTLGHPGYALFHSRFPDGRENGAASRETACTSVCPSHLAHHLTELGIAAVVRGHDPVGRFNTERHLHERLHGLSVIHADCEGSSRSRGAYLYITTEGAVHSYVDNRSHR